MKKLIPIALNLLFALVVMGWSSHLHAQGYSGGDGSSGNPYQVATLADLGYLSEHNGDWGFYFIQTADIDASATSSWNSGDGFSPIGDGSNTFFGGYDGQGHTITDLFINRPSTDDVGLFGFTEYMIIIKNLGLVNVDITGNSYVGAIGGEVFEIDNCYATGTVTGTDNVGGLAGLAGFINQCFSACNVTGNNSVGGLAAYNLGGIYNCYAVGTVTGSGIVGGLVGFNDGAIIQFCYSTGSVSGTTDAGGLLGFNNFGSADDCFWDTQTSGQSVSAGGTGMTTAEMKRVGTYLSDPSLFNPWDFTLASNLWGFNGSDNNGYPFLRLEGYTPGDIWLGTTSTGWTDTGNWSDNTPPVSTDNVLIPDVLTDPVISTVVNPVNDLTVEAGGLLTIATGGGLTVNTAMTNNVGDAGVVIEEEGSLITSSYIHGTVKRHITSNNAWHLLANPVVTSDVYPYNMPFICDGNFTPLTTDFNSTTGTTYDFFFFGEYAPDGKNWINIKNTDWSVNTSDFGNPPRWHTMVGYLVQYSAAPNLFGGSEDKVFSGRLAKGSMGSYVTNYRTSYNLVGNSYPSYIDWKSSTGWDRTHLEAHSTGKNILINALGYDFWIWNDAVGNYGVYNSALSGDAGSNGVSRYIPPTQGFFVKAVTNGNLMMDDPVRCHSTQAWLKTEDNTLRIGVSSAENTYSDEVLLAFNASATGGSDKFYSLYDEAPSLYLPVDKDNYSIRFLSDIGSNPAIPLSFKAGKDGNYTITVSETEKFSNVYLQDLKTGSMQDVKAQPAYVFTGSTADDANRFLLRFTPLGIDPNQSGHNNIFIYDNVLNVNNPEGSVITVYTLMGTKILEKQTNNESLYQLPLPLPTGYYLVKVTNGKTIYSEKVFVK